MPFFSQNNFFSVFCVTTQKIMAKQNIGNRFCPIPVPFLTRYRGLFSEKLCGRSVFRQFWRGRNLLILSGGIFCGKSYHITLLYHPPVYGACLL